MIKQFSHYKEMNHSEFISAALSNVGSRAAEAQMLQFLSAQQKINYTAVRREVMVTQLVQTNDATNTLRDKILLKGDIEKNIQKAIDDSQVICSSPTLKWFAATHSSAC